MCQADRCRHRYAIRFRDALGKQREEAGFGTQDDAIERLTQNYAERKKTAPSVAEARRELGRRTVAEYAKQWRPGNGDDGVLHGVRSRCLTGCRAGREKDCGDMGKRLVEARRIIDCVGCRGSTGRKC
ncbi:hypothetical protein [Streptomyces sp. NPDC096152]|uniref:hypothetical protein n=1 Tax=Streptomyces sp. NPDC096152 TaxID=3366078 RepID=UPI00382AA201